MSLFEEVRDENRSACLRTLLAEIRVTRRKITKRAVAGPIVFNA